MQCKIKDMAWKALDQKLVAGIFPAVDYAISMPCILRNGLSYVKKDIKHVPIDMLKSQTTNVILSVKNVKDWHIKNLAKNPSHYSLSSRMTKTKLIAFFSERGARIHCNSFDQGEGTKMKYWVVGHDDLKDDLNYWETLAASSFMHLPSRTLVENKEIQLLQTLNLKSAIAFCALTSPSESSEFDFFKKIVSIPLLCNSSLSFIRKEGAKMTVEENLEDLRAMYYPIIEEYFKPTIAVSKGMITIGNSLQDRRLLYSNLPDNILQNIETISVKKYDLKKQVLPFKERNRLITELMGNTIDSQVSQLKGSARKIMLVHRKTKLFLLLLGNAFLAAFFLFKYTLKCLFLLYSYKFAKKKKEARKKKNQQQ